MDIKEIERRLGSVIVELGREGADIHDVVVVLEALAQMGRDRTDPILNLADIHLKYNG